MVDLPTFGPPRATISSAICASVESRDFIDDGADHVVAFDESWLPRSAYLLRVDSVRLTNCRTIFITAEWGDCETLPRRTACHALNQDGMDEFFAKIVRQRFHFVPRV